MLIHVFDKMGKCHCRDIEGYVVSGPTTVDIECEDDLYKCINSGSPCCIMLTDDERNITLYGCTVNGKTITYAKAYIGR